MKRDNYVNEPTKRKNSEEFSELLLDFIAETIESYDYGVDAFKIDNAKSEKFINFNAELIQVYH